MYITSDHKHTHLCLSHGQFYLLLLLLLIILVVTGVVGFNYYKTNYYDSSVNGSETLEEQQNTIPPDVQQALLKMAPQLNPVIPAASPTAAQVPKPVRVPILMYHYVEYVKDQGDKMRISLNTPPVTLENEIKTLQESGYTFMTNSELADVLDDKAKLPPKPILLTFDDGYRDFYTDAYPILKKYHAKATQYVISGFLNNANHLTTAQLMEIAKDGLVEIGAHTVHHVWLRGLSLKKASTEVFQSKIMLGKLIGKQVLSLAYPFGAFDEQTIQVVKEAGFTSAVSTIPGINQRPEYKYFLYRLRPGARTGQALLDWLNQIK